MKRRDLLGRAALAALAAPLSARAAQQAPASGPPEPALPQVLQQAALQTPLASSSALLALARAGQRLVAAGERGIVIYSDDQGRHWSQAQVPVQTSLTALHFADERRGWAAGHMGVVLATTDGGTHWQRQLHGQQAAQRLLATAADEAQRKQAQRLLADGPDKPFFDLDAQGSQAWVVGAYGLAFESRDGGQAWTPLTHRLPNPRHLHLYGVRSQGEALFIAGEQGLLLRSRDRGASFEALVSPYKGSFFGLLAARSGSLLAYGLRGHALRSTDQGESWAAVDTGVSSSLSAGLEGADGTLMLLAQNGDLLISRDDGLHFDRRPAAPPFPAAALAAADARTLVLAGLRGLKRLDPA